MGFYIKKLVSFTSLGGLSFDIQRICALFFQVAFLFLILSFSLSAQSKLYWSDWGSNKIQSANLDGTVIVDIASGLSNAKGDVGLDFVNKKVFWIDNTAGILQMSNLDGSGIKTLVIPDDYWKKRSLVMERKSGLVSEG